MDLREEGRGFCEEFLPVVNFLTLLEFLFSDYGVCVKPAVLEEYWLHAKDHFKWAGAHPGFHRRSLPLSLYGDEAKYVDSSGFQEKVLVVLMSCPLWNPKSTRAGRWPLFACRQSLMVPEKTLSVIYRYISWCFNVLQTGERPDQGYLGTLLPPKEAKIFNGLTFSLVEVRGDWAWHCGSLNLASRWNSLSMCFRCPAKLNPISPEQSYAHRYDDSAWWTSRIYSHVKFINTQLKTPTCIPAAT